MKGRIAVVTGGSRGIGFAVAVRFLRDGMHVAVLDIRDEAAERFLRDGMHVAVLDIRDEAAEHLAAVGHKTGVRVLHIPTDVSSYQQVREAGAKVREEFGRLDVWVNNAGWDRIIPFLSTAPSDWERVVGINLMGVVHGTRVALEGMLAGDAGGAIVNVASDAGRVGSSGEAVYSAAKGGVIAFTKAVARGRPARNPGQLRMPGPDGHAASRGELPGGGGGEDHRGDEAGNPLPAPGNAGGDRVGGPVPRLGRSLLHHRAGLERQRRAEHGGVKGQHVFYLNK